MKKYLLGFLVLVLFSCKKNHDNTLTGTWKWDYSIGGIAVNKVSPTNNITVSLKISDDLTYTALINNQLIQSGKYNLSNNQNYTIIHFDKTIVVDKLVLFNDQLIFKIENGTLKLNDSNVSDGYTHLFEK